MRRKGRGDKTKGAGTGNSADSNDTSAQLGRGAETKGVGIDEEIPADVSSQAGWRPARQVIDPVKAKVPARRITINLDQDIVAIFKAEALLGGPPYQVAINQALRAYLHDRELPERDRAVRTVLTALEDEAVKRKLRAIR